MLLPIEVFFLWLLDVVDDEFFLLAMRLLLLLKWWALWDLNPRPTGYEPDALTN